MGLFALAGDPELAKFLLKGGKDDLAKKSYDAALTKFERAEREDPTLIEAIYQQAFTLEKRGDVRGAVQTYRRYMAGVESKAKTGSASKDEVAQSKKAQERVDVLAAGVAERRKLDDAFVESLMGFARANFVRDPAIAAEALRIVLGVRPDHAEAKKMLAQVQPAAPTPTPTPGGKDPAGGPPKPAAGAEPVDAFKSVKAWKDLFDTKYFGDNEGWTYETDKLVMEQHGGGAVVRAPVSSPTGARYAMEIECRIVDSYGEKPQVGIVFAYRDGDLYSLMLTEKEAILHRTQAGENADVARVDLVPPGSGGWHRLGIVVHASQVEVWLDGKKVADHAATRRLNLIGDLGLFQQECKAEVRVLRFGDLVP